jgi:hypothetical protein
MRPCHLYFAVALLLAGTESWWLAAIAVALGCVVD